jgi:hypothetical protein
MCHEPGARRRVNAAMPTNAFVPVQECWICAVIEAVAEAAWLGGNDLTLRDWLSVTAGEMRHRMLDHGVTP